ncbi:uroporphyrinogen-III C-methyltransferase [Halomonas korlensis]|uniref:Uroporphyrin-3 C-methyltransferase n=1 Tax=Halomonas korlensis TaxID=463301 RepID=A0A1I7K5U0_9GAMM|nr:uroporphyrinogen-III C-methyltransferase [Halomonas korlensis]SFU92791.1 uroporphyrin-3 C-methyltransferase [Halomonas korlensis]
MSKQPHDQDEQQTPTGAAKAGPASASPGDEADKSGPTAKGKSRRRGRGGQTTASAAASTTGTAKPDATPATESSKPASSATPAGSDKTQPASSSADTPSSTNVDKSAIQAPNAATPGSVTSSVDKPGTGKEGADKEKEGAGKEGTGKESTTQPDKPAAAQASSTKTSGPSTAAPRPAGSGGGGAAAPRPSSGDGRGSKGGGKAGIVALVLVILLALGVALFGWQAWQKLDAQQQRLAAVEARSEQAATADQLAELESRFDEGEQERQASLDNALSELRSEFNDYRSSVDETLDQVLAELSREQNTDEREWLHAEAAYLLRLANQRLQLERDVEGAAALLRTADERLEEADNPALVPVRREIAEELAALESVPEVDRTGLYLALNAQQEQLARQPLAQDIEQIAANSSIEEAPTGSWQNQLSRFGQELKDLVTVRQHDQALEALISPEQESYLRQSVRLVLEQAQLALLKEEQELYDASLDKVLTLIEGYYDTDDSGVQSVIARLEELKQRSIRPELPDISDSQQALAEFIDNRYASRGDEGDDA